MSENNIILKADAATETRDDLQRVHGVAYSGGPLLQAWADAPVYIDLEGLRIRDQVPLLSNHENDPSSRVGVVEASVVDGRLLVEGAISLVSYRGSWLAEEGRSIPWQLSVSCAISRMERVRAGEAAQVNGIQADGPAYIAREAELLEVSIVAVGADAHTELIVASAKLKPEQKEPTMSEENTTPQIVQAAEPAAQAQAEPVVAQAAAPEPPALNEAAIRAAIRAAAIEEERARVASVREICAHHPEVGDRAVAEGWDENQTRKELLNVINASYTTTAPSVASATPAPCNQVLKAAAMQATGTAQADIVAACGEQAAEAADRRFHGAIGLQELIIEAAAANGCNPGVHRLNSSNWYEVTASAMRTVSASSTTDLPGLLGAVVNRRLLDGFASVDASWREVADIASTSNFNAFKSYRLVAGGGFQKVPNGGELKYGTLGESEYSNQAETYGEILSITRQDIINDDLNAFSRIPFLLGQDAAIKINEIFWGTFLNNSSFFAAGNHNVVTSTALSVDGITSALATFRALRDESGRLLGQSPAILLVPIELEVLAGQIYNDISLIAVGMGNSRSVQPAGNPHRGKYKPVATPYLSDTNLSGSSSTTWYLLANPAFRAAVQIAFLNGVQAPVVQTSEAVFDTLGIRYRAYLDWGVALQDPKAGVKVTA